MAEGIVETLEMVEVHHQHAEPCPIAFATRDLPVERLDGLLRIRSEKLWAGRFPKARLDFVAQHMRHDLSAMGTISEMKKPRQDKQPRSTVRFGHL